MRAIFISYRREDAEGQAGRLFTDLTRIFGAGSVFMDVAGLKAGRDFRQAIDEQVASCGVLLAVIGKSWLGVADGSGNRRLDDPHDFVRLETAAALKRDIPVVPVLVHGAPMPKADQLPPDMADLVYRSALEVTHARWDSDVEVLANQLRPYVDAPVGPAASHATAGSRRGLIAALAGGMAVLLLGLYAWSGSGAASVGSPEPKPAERPPETRPAPDDAEARAAAEHRARWPYYEFPEPNGGLLVFSILPDGNPACASYDGENCLWGVKYDDIDFRKVKPMVCGEEHRARYGVTGYEDSRHWCSLARTVRPNKS